MHIEGSVLLSLLSYDIIFLWYHTPLCYTCASYIQNKILRIRLALRQYAHVHGISCIACSTCLAFVSMEWLNEGIGSLWSGASRTSFQQNSLHHPSCSYLIMGWYLQVLWCDKFVGAFFVHIETNQAHRRVSRHAWWQFPNIPLRTHHRHECRSLLWYNWWISWCNHPALPRCWKLRDIGRISEYILVGLYIL